MPRAPSSKFETPTVYYNAPYNDAQGNTEPYLEPTQIIPVIQEPVPRKKHVCPTCDKTFTTSGHLARHARVHTGEKNHKCPFPGCETRCSRQDNLQQHYRIHLSPGSRRTSTAASRTSALRTWPNGPTTTKRRSRTANASVYSTSESPPAPSQSPPLDPPALEQAHSHDSPPGPDSPPALVQANLPGMTAPYPDSVSSRSASPHEYTSIPPYIDLPSVNYSLGGGISHSSKVHSPYLDSPTAYRDHPQNALYGYDSESSTHTRNDVRDEDTQNQHSFDYSYDALHHSQSHVSLSPIHHLHHSEPTHTHSPPPTSNDFNSIPAARHSISDIPQSQAYLHPPPLTGPPSPASVRSSSSHPSLASTPHTPSYTYRNEELPEANGYQSQDTTKHSPTFEYRDDKATNGFSVPDTTTHDSIPDSGNLSAGYYDTQGEVVHGDYPVGLPAEPPVSYSDRYPSLPPVSTQSRGVPPTESQMTHLSSSLSMAVSSSSAAAVSHYLHHPRPIAGLYPNTLPQLTLQPVDWGRSHHAAIPGVHH